MSHTRSGGRVQPARPGDPTRIGPYRIIGRLGSGGMGTVHAALAPDGTRVAVKVIHQAQSEDSEFRARFRREVALSSRVFGPCLLPLLAADPEAAAPWLATEYAPGPTLNQHLAAHGPLTGGTLYAFATGTARALTAIHAAGVVHRDVKPQNVILTPAGPRVLDFGIAHAADGTSVTRTGVMTGTSGWISPEHYRTGTAGPEGDVFAWGALVAHAATGRHPFGAGAPDVVAFRVMSGEPDLEGVPEALRGIVEEALAKAPEARPGSDVVAERCSELLAAQTTQVVGTGADLTTVGELVAAEWDVPTVDDPAWRAPARRVRKRLVGIVLVVATVIGGLVGGWAARGSGQGGDPPAASPTPVGQPDRLPDTAAPSKGDDGAVAEGRTPGAESSSPAAQSTHPVAPSPAYTRDDDAQPTIDEFAKARIPVTPAEKLVAKAVQDDALRYLRENGYRQSTHVEVSFNPKAQTVFVTFGPQDRSEIDRNEDIRAVHYTTCTTVQSRFGDDISWPYGRYAVLFRHSMADPRIYRSGEVTMGHSCRV
ncbi:serine/threonine protein kinase [Streptomyces xanthophaeus]|uniref:serine/threonine protein kinase n=1 Tax=Streptomyces xanthophaeus TaxID=67385 RepID=UPI0036981D47